MYWPSFFRTRSPRRCRSLSRQRFFRPLGEFLEERHLLAAITVTGTGDTIAVDGVVTLREAITSANNNADVNADVVGVGAYGADTINFNIAGSGVQTIAPTAALPAITDRLFIDGYTQPGASENTLALGNDAVLRIELSGASAGNVDGLTIDSFNCVVRGLVINRFARGIHITPGASHIGNVISGNFIGTDPTGTVAQANTQGGIWVEGALDTTIGGLIPGARNLISGNGGHGIEISGAGATGTTIRTNYIGTNAAGNAMLGNGSAGIFMTGTGGGARIGTADADAGNLIGGNGDAGIYILGSTTNPVSGVSIQNNSIGGNLSVTPFLEMPNGQDGDGLTDGGIYVQGNTTNGQIGVNPSTTSIGNFIVYNKGSGIELRGDASGSPTGYRISRNSMGINTRLGIDLVGGTENANGVTADDAGDTDTGPNNLINKPNITSAELSGNQLTISGSFLGSAAGGNYRVEFFASGGEAISPSGFGEGAKFITFDNISNSNGTVNFGPLVFTVNNVLATDSITATIIDENGNTSEFSNAVPLTPSPPPPVDPLEVININDSGPGSLREAINYANTHPNGATPDEIKFNIPGSGEQRIDLLTALPAITETVIINGYTQPGTSPNTLANGSNAVLRVRINGAGIPNENARTGLTINADNCVIKGLSFTRFLDTGSLDIPGLADGAAIVVNSKGNSIVGNFIGLNSSGVGVVIGGLLQLNTRGVLLNGADADNNTIGGTTPADRNLITGNGGSTGAPVYVKLGSNNQIIGNDIGLDINGAIPTDTQGARREANVLIEGGDDNVVGGTAANTPNRLVGGVRVQTDILRTFLPGTTIEGTPIITIPHDNLILGNTWTEQVSSGLSILLDPRLRDHDGNQYGPQIQQDPLDADDGANGLQNVPQILSAIKSGATTAVKIRLTSAASTTYRVEIYADNNLALAGIGQGNRLLQAVNLTTDASGFVEQTFNLSSLAAGNFLSASATGPDGTSEFAKAKIVQEAVSLPLVVTNTNDSGAGSLRQAILNANAMINGGSPDVITFNIPGSGLKTIAPTSRLPIIADPVVIDGYSQPGTSANTLASGDNAVLLINVNGASLPGGATVLAVAAPDCTVRGLVINGAGTGSILSGTSLSVLAGADGTRIEGNFIGTNATGTAAAPKPGQGITVIDSANLVVGGTTPAARNILSGNFNGLIVQGELSAGGLVAGNYIGTNASGTAAVPNAVNGILVGTLVSNFLIGGNTASSRNLISGNASAGINFGGALAIGSVTGDIGPNVRIQGNYIGTNIGGTAAIGNGKVEPDDFTIDSGGIVVSDVNTLPGAVIEIGGSGPGEGNLISGNVSNGIGLSPFISLSALKTGLVRVRGNLIGTNATGTAALPNGLHGVFSSFLQLNLDVGGTSAADRNVISGNGASGISVSGLADVIRGNYIGTDITGAAPLGNGAHGVLTSIFGTRVGDPSDSSAANLIAFNAKDGIAVALFAVGNTFSRNSIHSNGGLGIDLADDGVTSTRDDLDADQDAANNLQNIPVIASALVFSTTTDVRVQLKNKPNTQYRVELFVSSAADPSGFGEGQTFIGSAIITTDASGLADTTVTINSALALGSFVTATVTDVAGTDGTSEFSAAVQAEAPTPLPTFSIDNVSTNEGNSGITAFTFTVTRSGDTSGTSIVDFTVAQGTATLADNDFTPLAPGTLTFIAGEITKAITVNVNGDTTVELDETFFVNLTRATGATIADNQGQGTILNDDAAPPPPPGSAFLAIGADANAKGQPRVNVYDAAGGLVSSFLAYEKNYRGGVRVAVGDVTGDGVPEIVTAPGRGRSPLVKVFTAEGVELPQFRIQAYAANFTGGVYVAVGDVLGDGLPDIVVTPAREGTAVKGLKNGGTEVRVFQNRLNANAAHPFQATPQSAPDRKFLAFAANTVGKLKFLGGATVAVGDVQPGGKQEVIVGSGSGMRATIRAFNVESAAASLVRQYTPLDASFRGGVFVAAARIDDDLAWDIIAGAGQGGGSRLEVRSGATGNLLHVPILVGRGTQPTSSPQSAVSVAAKDTNGDGIPDQIFFGQSNDGRTLKIQRLPSLNSSAVDLVLASDPDFGGGFNLG